MRFFSSKLNIYLFLGIILIGLVLRLYGLSDVPAGFFCDEASIGYNAYEILITGHDEHGAVMPVFFEAFGEYKTPIEIYSTIPSILIFGLNEFSVRFVSALYGLASVVVILFLTREVFEKNKNKNFIALLSAFFLAISPWHIHMSRIAMEGITPFVFFVLLGTYFFLKSRKKEQFLILSSITFSLGMYTYFPSRLFIPVFVVILCLIFYKNLTRNIKVVLIAALFAVAILLPYTPTIFNGSLIARWQQVSIFSSPPKNQSVLSHIVINYIRHFSFDFLFTKGDFGMPGQFITRQSVKDMGELYLFQLPVIILGLFFCLKKHPKEGIFIFLWLLIYPLGSMFTTNESPNSTRSIIGVIPFTILSAAGVYFFWSLLKRFIRRTFRLIIFIGFIMTISISVIFYVYVYFVQYPLYSSDFWGWQYGARPVIQYFVSNEKNYDEFYMEGAFNAPYIFFKFYAPNDCKNCQLGTPKDNYNPAKKQLFAVSANYLKTNQMSSFQTQDIIYYPNGDPAFFIGEVKKR